MARSTGNTVRAIVLGVCTLVILGLFGAVVRQSYVVNAKAAEIVRLEAQGASMLHYVTSLLAELVGAQSAAVRGEQVPAENVNEALADLAAEDRLSGRFLQTTQRLADLTAQVEATFARGETGRPAYDSYSVLITLTVDLIRRIGDTSHLVHDPDLDSYYLMDAAIIRLPTAMVLAGKASDIVTLAGGATLSGEDAISAAVARFGVSAAAEEVSAGLTKSVDFTARSALGANITERLDTFKAAADSFAPPTMLGDLSGPVDAATLAANARRVSAAADPLAHRLLGELEVLLGERAAKLSREWRFTAVAGGLAAAIALVILWLVILPRPTPVAAAGTTEAPARHARADDVAVGSFAYARELLDGDRFVPVGRAARPRTREPGDAG